MINYLLIRSYLQANNLNLDNQLPEVNWKQAGAELCQAQEKLELARNCGRLPLTLELRSSLIYLEIGVVFHFGKN